MSSEATALGVLTRQCMNVSAVCVALWTQGAGAVADTLVDPPVFASQNGVLDIMMVAMPQAIPTIAFTPPGGSTPINPMGWVYQICARPPSGLSCPANSSTVSPYGGTGWRCSQATR
jgi:hypothetical protein